MKDSRTLPDGLARYFKPSVIGALEDHLSAVDADRFTALTALINHSPSTDLEQLGREPNFETECTALVHVIEESLDNREETPLTTAFLALSFDEILRRRLDEGSDNSSESSPFIYTMD